MVKVTGGSGNTIAVVEQVLDVRYLFGLLVMLIIIKCLMPDLDGTLTASIAAVLGYLLGQNNVKVHNPGAASGS